MNRKYIFNSARLFFQNKGVDKLKKYAQEGWVFEKFCCKGFVIQLKKTEPQDIQYQLDFQLNPEETYFSARADQGWQLVDTTDYIQVFQAPEESMPFNADYEPFIKELKQEGNWLGKYVFILGIFLVLSFVFRKLAAWQWLQLILLGVILLLSVTFTIVLIPYVLNKCRVYYLMKQTKNKTIVKEMT